MNTSRYKYHKLKKTEKEATPNTPKPITKENQEKSKVMNPYTQIKNYKLSNIKHYIQGKWRAFIIRQYNKLNLPESSIFQRIIKYEKYLGTCPHCGCPMSEILLTDKECKEDTVVSGPEPSGGWFWQMKNGELKKYNGKSPKTT